MNFILQKSVVYGTILGLKYIKNEFDENSAIINIASIAGLSNSILPIYQSTKRAIIEFTKSIGVSIHSRIYLPNQYDFGNRVDTYTFPFGTD